MHRICKAPVAAHKVMPLLVLAFSTVLLLAAGPVLARQCPRGQILRVSKNICVSKGQAFGGQTIGRHVFYGPTFHGPTKHSSVSAYDDPAGDLQPAAEAETLPASVPAKRPKSPPPSLAPSASPYGELILESFPKP